MIKFNKSVISKISVLVLITAFLYSDLRLYTQGTPLPGNNPNPAVESPGHARHTFNTALKEYNNKSYKNASAKLESILSLNEAGDHSFKAKVYLLLGACYEKVGEKEKTKELFVELKKMLTDKSIHQVPEIPGVETGSLTLYREVFEDESFFKFNEPVAVTEMLRKNVVHAPRKSIEQKEREKKKRKSPWLIAVGAVVVLGTAAVLIFLSKENPASNEFPAIEWIQVPAGEFLMGDNLNEGAADEQPVHPVYLDEYYISKYEITWGQYLYFCESTNRGHKFFSGISQAANWVSWNDTKAFCDWISIKTGENIDLPTEAQWEKAARGTYRTRYPWGDDPPTTDKAHYWREDSSGSMGHVGPNVRPAGASRYGVHDMAGNAAEWCLDRYSSSYYSVSPPRNPTGPTGGSFRVLRGGDFLSDDDGIRSANRDFHDPANSEETIGFRVVKK